jgi:hypothetical protein
MASDLLTGWNLWLKAGNHFWHLSVAENDRVKAEKIALARVPKAEIIYGNELPHSVMQFLKAERGQVFEWVSIEPGKPSESPWIKRGL